MAGPVNKSQFSVRGIRSSFSGTFSPCGQMGRSVAHSTFITSPISPFHIHSHTKSVPSSEEPWLPIWVTTPVEAARRVSRRDSYTECVSGFWQYTCLPIVMASAVMMACVWSAVATITASMDFPISSYILR